MVLAENVACNDRVIYSVSLRPDHYVRVLRLTDDLLKEKTHRVVDPVGVASDHGCQSLRFPDEKVFCLLHFEAKLRAHCVNPKLVQHPITRLSVRRVPNRDMAIAFDITLRHL